MNQDIDMLNVDDLNMEFNPQSHLNFNNNAPTLNTANNSEHLNGQFNPTMRTTDQIENMNENIEESEESDEDDEANNSKKKEDNDDDEDDEDDLFINDNDMKTPGEILDEFCQKLEDINTTLPDSVINYYMRKSGFIVNDPKLVKIISIASQKFISEIVNDVWQRQRLKTKQGSNVASTTQTATTTTSATTTSSTNPSTSSGAGATAGTSTASASGSEQPKLSKAAAAAANANATNAANTAQLTLEDLTQVLADYGINVKKPYYFI